MSGIQRRQFVIGTGTLLAASLVKAQPVARQVRIGVLQLGSEALLEERTRSFLAGLRDRGYAIGRNLIADFRYGDRFNQLPALADELIALKPDLLVGTEITSMVMKRKTSVIPIVLLISADPVGAGLVQSLARPGTNVTGMSGLLYTLLFKQVDLLTEIVPKMSRMALFTGRFDPPKDSAWFGRPDPWETAAQQAAKAKALELVVIRAESSEQMREAFAALKGQHVEGLVVAANAIVTRLHKELVGEIQRMRLPAAAGHRGFVQAGGLLSYGPDLPESYRYAAKFVDRILKGAKPAELPVEQVAKYELLINGKAARELGLKIPQSILLRADRVIE